MRAANFCKPINQRNSMRSINSFATYVQNLNDSLIDPSNPEKALEALINTLSIENISPIRGREKDLNSLVAIVSNLKDAQVDLSSAVNWEMNLKNQPLDTDDYKNEIVIVRERIQKAIASAKEAQLKLLQIVEKLSEVQGEQCFVTRGKYQVIQ